ncbi:MAG TPA: hypothetical protein VGQ15_15850 [Gaiellaceae bacterium]|nr:hypothetical protein [Gaiellaceae bacterium]
MATGLVDYLRRCACEARLVRENVVEASPRSAANSPHSRVELDGYLRVWRLMHPSATAELVESRPAGLREPTRSAGAANEGLP